MSWDRARSVARTRSRAALPATAVDLAEALGHTLADPLVARCDLPPFPTAAMDGWAVAGVGPWRLRDGDVPAGRPSAALTAGTAVAIATGAQVPAGATGVLRHEHGGVEPSGLLVERRPGEVAPGTDIRPQGEECRNGDLLLPAGATVTAPVLGLAAAAGHDRLVVHRRPSVEVLVLGDELIQTGAPRDGRVRDALGPMLPALLAGCGAAVTGPTRVPDDFDALLTAVERSAASADVVVTTGSTAAGPRDFLHGVLERLGARMLVDSVAVRPGHPMLLAELPAADGRTCRLVGLPGNPLAAVVGAVTLAAPLLRRLGASPDPGTRLVPTAATLAGHPTDTRLLAVLESEDGVVPLPFEGTAMLRGLALADGLAVVPPGGVCAGTTVELLSIPGR